METLRVCAWVLAVCGAFLGYGQGLLRLLRNNERRWIVHAGAGTGVVIALLGTMNLMGWILTMPLFILVVAGDALLLCLWKGHHAKQLQEEAPAKGRWTLFTVATWLLLALVACTALSGIDCRIVNYFDDPQAYFAYPENALQTGALQAQPFSERRINTSLGANYLLDALLAVDGDVRSISFLDLCFGYLLYVAALWAVGEQMLLSFEKKGLLLLLLIILPLIQLNATIVYLCSGLMLVLLLTMHATKSEARANWKNGVLWGVLASALCLTKSSYIVFTLPLIGFFVLIHAARTRTLAQLWNGAVSMLTLCVLTVPWMVQQHRNEGTYFFPTLGRGFHASHWGVLPLPGQTQGITGTLMTALPNLMALLCAAFLIWKLRSRANPFGLPFLLAAAAATPLVALATGGEVIDRFSFPFHIPALLLFAGVLLAAAKANTPSPRWLWAGRALLVVWIIAILYVWQVKSHMYRLYEHRILAAVGIMPRYLEKFELNLSDSVMNAEAERARRVQQTLPAGVQALEAALYAYPYDFHRNTIYIADYPGMAGWAPGIPVGQGPEPVRAYFISHGIHYFICDRRLTHNNEDIGDFLKQPGISIPAKNFLLHPASTHFNTGWSREEDSVSRDVRHNLLTLAESDDKLYDDGTVVAVHLRER